MIKIYNTLSRKKETFKPIIDNTMNMYVCGVTAYDLCHIGHARTFIFFDLMYRYFRYCGYKVNYIRNITDIDDKIIKKANQNKEKIESLTSKMIFKMKYDFNNLNILIPNHEPQVTHHIQDIIKMIKQLISLKFAYISPDGDVMFCVRKFKNYGKLSLQNINNLNINKKQINKKTNNIDFVLWKKSKPGEPKWMSPWGSGRPGWHIECSAISHKYLKNKFDIHGGGSDLIFPHHENEIAQSFCCYKQNANYWMHVGMIIVNNKKMSKSLNNFFTIHDTLNFFDSETIRYFLMSSHYRSPLKFSQNRLHKARISLDKLYVSLKNTNYHILPSPNNLINEFETRFINAINDDFNTPLAYSILFKMMHQLNKLKEKNQNEADNLAAKLRQLAQIIGLLTKEPDNFLKKNKTNNKEINLLIENRNKYRLLKDWENSDKIRNKLTKMGIIIEDDLDKTTWRVK